MSLGKTLSDLRKNARLTQSELGERLSISAQAISKWENDASQPDISTLMKLAEIYGITIADIVSPEKIASSAGEESDVAKDGSVFDGLYDLYIVEIDGDNKIKLISYIRNMLGVDLVFAKNAVESLPFVIQSSANEEECEKITAYLEEAGAKLAKEPATGNHPKRKIVSLTSPEPPKEDLTMRKRFITANLTAGIPAIVITALLILWGGIANAIDVLFSVYLAASIYSLIFLLWYPTIVRKLLAPLWGFEPQGLFAMIGKLIFYIPLILWTLLVGAVSPIIYAFSIKTRIERMRGEDIEDDIFF